mmetsp:Transcript_20896/g.52807  ORF Transcript_20896/g.52807 Transcript_20896/m.52807 type:complete len:1258 (-) Transcript_20896:167-3940(-)
MLGAKMEASRMMKSRPLCRALIFATTLQESRNVVAQHELPQLTAPRRFLTPSLVSQLVATERSSGIFSDRDDDDESEDDSLPYYLWAASAILVLFLFCCVYPAPVVRCLGTSLCSFAGFFAADAENAARKANAKDQQRIFEAIEEAQGGRLVPGDLVAGKRVSAASPITPHTPTFRPSSHSPGFSATTTHAAPASPGSHASPSPASPQSPALSWTSSPVAYYPYRAKAKNHAGHYFFPGSRFALSLRGAEKRLSTAKRAEREHALADMFHTAQEQQSADEQEEASRCGYLVVAGCNPKTGGFYGRGWVQDDGWLPDGFFLVRGAVVRAGEKAASSSSKRLSQHKILWKQTHLKTKKVLAVELEIDERTIGPPDESRLSPESLPRLPRFCGRFFPSDGASRGGTVELVPQPASQAVDPARAQDAAKSWAERRGDELEEERREVGRSVNGPTLLQSVGGTSVRRVVASPSRALVCRPPAVGLETGGAPGSVLKLPVCKSASEVEDERIFATPPEPGTSYAEEEVAGFSRPCSLRSDSGGAELASCGESELLERTEEILAKGRLPVVGPASTLLEGESGPGGAGKQKKEKGACCRKVAPEVRDADRTPPAQSRRKALIRLSLLAAGMGASPASGAAGTSAGDPLFLRRRSSHSAPARAVTSSRSLHQAYAGDAEDQSPKDARREKASSFSLADVLDPSEPYLYVFLSAAFVLLCVYPAPCVSTVGVRFGVFENFLSPHPGEEIYKANKRDQRLILAMIEQGNAGSSWLSSRRDAAAADRLLASAESGENIEEGDVGAIGSSWNKRKEPIRDMKDRRWSEVTLPPEFAGAYPPGDELFRGSAFAVVFNYNKKASVAGPTAVKSCGHNSDAGIHSKVCTRGYVAFESFDETSGIFTGRGLADDTSAGSLDNALLGNKNGPFLIRGRYDEESGRLYWKQTYPHARNFLVAVCGKISTQTGRTVTGRFVPSGSGSRGGTAQLLRKPMAFGMDATQSLTLELAARKKRSDSTRTGENESERLDPAARNGATAAEPPTLLEEIRGVPSPDRRRLSTSLASAAHTLPESSALRKLLMLTTVEKEKDRGRDQKKRRVRKKEAKLPSTHSSKRGLSRLSAVAAEVSGFVADGAWRYFVNEDHEPSRGNQPEAGGHFQRSTSSLDEYFLTGDRMSVGTSSAREANSREKSSIRPSFAARQSLAAMAREVKEEEERRASRRFAVEGTEDGHDQVTGQSVQADHDGMSNVFRKIVAEGAKTSQSKRSWFFKQ